MIIAISQVVVSIILIVLILLQERSTGISGLLGGGEGGAFYQTRRGAEKSIFIGTIVFAAIFVGLAIAQLVL